jgi:microsomal dipeptidase-like Zn-dependent dipeptidase
MLETGHSSPAECLAIVREARRQGVEHIVVTHAMLPPVGMSIAQMQEAAKDGAYLEFVYNALIGPNKALEIGDVVKAIRAVGPQHCILSSDLGQAGNPLHPDGLVAFFKALREAGVPAADIELMAKTNPAKVLRLQ